jgi:hypothetical protein
VGLLVAALVFSVASGSKGDRAESGHCPAGEVCSPDTPSGLYFKGPGFADVFLNYDVRPTAVGGQQTIQISPAGLFEHLENFDAESTEPAFSVSRVAPPEVTIQADAAGSAYLRIFEPLTGALYDRLMVSSREVETIEVEPIVFESSFDDDPLYPPLYWGGDALPWIARLYGGSSRLVDETLTFGGDGTTNASVTQLGLWDLAEVTPTGGAFTISVGAASGSGVTGEGSAELAYEVDYILADVDMPVPETHNASELLSLCFAAYFGERRILGIPWEYTMTGPNGEEPELSSPALLQANCVVIQAGTAGVWQLDVIAGNVTESYEITMLPPQPPPPPPQPAATPDENPRPATPKYQGTPGWRAWGRGRS